MQNMSGSQLRESFAFPDETPCCFARRSWRSHARLWRWLGQAHAKSYTMPKVDIQAQVETDGALQVTEQRTFDFDGDFSAVWWAFDGLPQQLPSRSTACVWRTSMPMARWWAIGRRCRARRSCSAGANRAGLGKFLLFDAPKNSVYVFFNASERPSSPTICRIIELDYTVVNGRRRIPT